MRSSVLKMSLLAVFALSLSACGGSSGSSSSSNGSGNGKNRGGNGHVPNEGKDFPGDYPNQWPCESFGGNGCPNSPSGDPNFPGGGSTNTGMNSVPGVEIIDWYHVPENAPTFSTGSNSKDVDLQRAQIEQSQLENRAQVVAQQFQMNLDSARQLTQLSDRMNALKVMGTMTDADRVALADAALQVAGISNREVSEAVGKMMNQKDRAAVEVLLTRAAVNLGMPSSAGLRDQILPSLGIDLRK